MAQRRRGCRVTFSKNLTCASIWHISLIFPMIRYVATSQDRWSFYAFQTSLERREGLFSYGALHTKCCVRGFFSFLQKKETSFRKSLLLRHENENRKRKQSFNVIQREDCYTNYLRVCRGTFLPSLEILFIRVSD